MKLREIQINKEILSNIEEEREEIRKFQLEVNHLAYKYGYILENRDIETDKLQKININLVSGQSEYEIIQFQDHTNVNPVVIVQIGFDFDKFWSKDNYEKQIYVFKTIDVALRYTFQKMHISLNFLNNILEDLTKSEVKDFTYKILLTPKNNKIAYLKYIYDKDLFDAFIVIEDQGKQVLNKKIDSPKQLYDFFYKLGKITWVDDKTINLKYNNREMIYFY